MSERDVVQDDAELLGPSGQLGRHSRGHGFSLGDEFARVELGHDGLQHLVGDGGKDPGDRIK